MLLRYSGGSFSSGAGIAVVIPRVRAVEAGDQGLTIDSSHGVQFELARTSSKELMLSWKGIALNALLATSAAATARESGALEGAP